jgi:glycerol-3-phosphate dehydrogenase (NAD(P)+)
MKVAVIGAGAWGTALAIQAAKAYPVKLWARDSGHISGMKKARSNPKYLGDFTFPDHLELTASLDEAVLTSDVIISSVPTSAFAEIIQNIQSIDPAKPIIWTNKGLETNSSLFPHEIIHDHLINKDLAYGVLSGPSFAAELVRDLPTAVTLATTNSDLSNSVAKIFHHGSMRVYLSDDIAGVTVGGSLKNIIAIASKSFCFGLRHAAPIQKRVAPEAFASFAALITSSSPKIFSFSTSVSYLADWGQYAQSSEHPPVLIDSNVLNCT